MKWFYNLDCIINELGSVSRAIAKFILSVIFLGIACGVVFALYKGVLYFLTVRPWWIKIFGF